jgi:DNA (cytosine-5)-methyltransferase 1
MRHGSLFSGIGGFDIAAEWMGWENVFHCEWNDFGKKILHYYWPNAIQYDDITKTDFTIHRGQIDILTGGFPCQPYSTAGKRLGKEDERHLWPHMLRAIQEIQPRWVVGENVLGLVNWDDGLVFQEVCADLEAQGYEVQPFVLPAASKGAPHSRQRVWFVAYNVSYSNNNGLNQRNGNNEINANQGGEYAQRDIKQSDGNGNATNTKCERLEGYDRKRQGCTKHRTDKGIFIGSKNKFHSPINWDNFPTQSPICGGDDGLPNQLDGITFSKWRGESIKGYGNAIVPQVVHTIFQTIEQYERPIHRKHRTQNQSQTLGA